MILLAADGTSPRMNKIDLFIEKNPDASSCNLRIYGQQFHRMMDFYFKICKNKTFTVTANTLWFRENYFNEEIKFTREDGESVYAPRKKYYEKLFDSSSKKKFLPEKSGDILVGIDLLIQGECPFLFFQNENGVQRWKISDDDDTICCVEVVNNMNTPHKANMHRKESFSQKLVFRTFEPNKLNDKRAKIKREVLKGESISLIQEELDSQFENNLENAVS